MFFNEVLTIFIFLIYLKNSCYLFIKYLKNVGRSKINLTNLLSFNYTYLLQSKKIK